MKRKNYPVKIDCIYIFILLSIKTRIETTNIDDGDFLHISDTSDGNKDKKVSILNILKKILGNRAFGGSGAIVTADASYQTMSNKRIDNIKLNSATAMTTTGDVINKLTGWNGQATDINKLTSIQTTKAELGYLHGVTGSIQDQINGIIGAISFNPCFNG